MNADTHLPPELESALGEILLRSSKGRAERLDSLVEAHPEHADRLRARVSELEGSDPQDPELGTRRIGPYELLSVLGQGGMGTVYLAQQTEPVRRRVAVKVVPGGSREVLARFELERQALALMDHPGIARVLDAGVSEAGQPYFVMERVEGVPLTAFADGQRLTVEERLDLFLQVCDAVQHAHRKGVLHRDLKPGNVLVGRTDGRPVAKVIDFGLARALDEPLAADRPHTLHGQLLGTPEYMSPEQAAGDVRRIDTRTDVYSLGVMLYELLAGVLPVETPELRAGGPGGTRDRILSADPDAPSVRVAALPSEVDVSTPRGLDRSAHVRRLRGDLDWVVMRAMAPEAERRYESPRDLARDLRRHLACEPVQAGPPSATYRLRKFVRRNRGRVSAAAVVLLALVAGLVGTQVGLARARDQKHRAERALDSIHDLGSWFVVDLHDRLEDVPGSMDVRRELVDRGLPYLEELWRQRADDREVALDVVRGYLRIGTLQGWPHRANLGDREGALASFAAALEGLDHVRDLGVDPATIDPLRLELHLRRADVLLADVREGAAAEELDRAEALVTEARDGEAARLRRFEIACRRALLARTAGDPTRALEAYLEAEDLLPGADREPPDWSTRDDAELAAVGILYHGLASLRSGEFEQPAGSAVAPHGPGGPAHASPSREDLEQARSDLERALEAYSLLFERHAGSAFALQSLVTVRQSTASVHRRLGDLDGALAAYDANVAALEALRGREPHNAWALEMRTVAHQDRARVLRDLGRTDESVAAFEEAVTAFDDLRRAVPSDPRHLRRQATALEMLAGVHGQRGDVAALVAAFGRAFTLWEPVQAAPLDDSETYAVLDARNRLVGQLLQLGAQAELLVALRDLDAGLRDQGADAAGSDLAEAAVRTRILMGVSLLALGEAEAEDERACERLEEALEVLRGAESRIDRVAGGEALRPGLDDMIRRTRELLELRHP